MRGSELGPRSGARLGSCVPLEATRKSVLAVFWRCIMRARLAERQRQRQRQEGPWRHGGGRGGGGDRGGCGRGYRRNRSLLPFNFTCHERSEREIERTRLIARAVAALLAGEGTTARGPQPTRPFGTSRLHDTLSLLILNLLPLPRPPGLGTATSGWLKCDLTSAGPLTPTLLSPLSPLFSFPGSS